MKKIFLTIGMFVFSLSVYCQKLIEVDNLVGYWEPDKHSTQLIIWYNKEGLFNVQEFDTVDGEPLTLVSSILIADTLKIVSRCESSGFMSEARFRFVDENTMESEVLDIDTKKVIEVVKYTRIK